MSQQEQTQAIAEQATAQVLAALAAYTAGTLTYEALVGVVAAYASAANSAAAALGDLSLAATLTLTTAPTAPIGVTRPADEPERFELAARTILADLPTAPTAEQEAEIARAQMRLTRLVDAEVRQAVAQAHDAALKAAAAADAEIVGWTRGLEPEACQLCRWWWREGRVWPPDHPFQHHTGCDCSQLIVTRKDAA